jgi:hypothetical protein
MAPGLRLGAPGAAGAIFLFTRFQRTIEVYNLLTYIFNDSTRDYNIFTITVKLNKFNV